MKVQCDYCCRECLGEECVEMGIPIFESYFPKDKKESYHNRFTGRKKAWKCRDCNIMNSHDEIMTFFRNDFWDPEMEECFSIDDREEIVMQLLGYSEELSQIMSNAFNKDRGIDDESE